MSKSITEVRQQLTVMGPELAKVLPDHVTPEKFERVTLTALQRAPDLLSCDRKSLFEAVMSCAQDGLIPDGKEAALVKFKDRVAYMPMIGGILKKVRQSGELVTITSQVVHEADTFEYWIDDQGEHLKHCPEMLSEPGKPKAVYAMARTTDGGVYIEVLRISDVEKIRAASRGANGGPWAMWWSEMARKSAIRRLAKRLPMSTDLESVINRDDQFYPYQEPQIQQASKAVSALTVTEAESTSEIEQIIEETINDVRSETASVKTASVKTESVTTEEGVF